MRISRINTAKTRALVSVSLALFVINLDLIIIPVTLPAIERDLHAQLHLVQWIVTVYALTFGVLVISAGRLVDRGGPRLMLIAGMLIFGIASVIAGSAANIDLLITGRVIQGVGAALLLPASLAAVTYTFAPVERLRAFGITTAVSALAFAIGPLLGGVLTDVLSWRWVFFINIPIVIVAVWFAFLDVSETRGEKMKSLNLASVALFGGAFFALLHALDISTRRGSLSGEFWVSLGAFFVLLILFGLNERQSEHRLLSWSLFRKRNFSTGIVLSGFVQIFELSLFFLTPLYLQVVRDYSPFQSGAALIPLTGIGLIAGPFFGSLGTKINMRILIPSGFILTAIAFFILTQLHANSTYLFLFFPLLIAGVGLWMLATLLTPLVLNEVDQAQSGLVSAVQMSAKMIGSALGVSLAIALVKDIANRRFPDLIHTHHITLPEEQKARITKSIADGPEHAQRLAAGFGPELKPKLINLINEGISDSLQITFLIFAIISVCVAIYAVAGLRK